MSLSLQWTSNIPLEVLTMVQTGHGLIFTINLVLMLVKITMTQRMEIDNLSYTWDAGRAILE